MWVTTIIGKKWVKTSNLRLGVFVINGQRRVQGMQHARLEG
jgi:hypothetical protein